MLYILAGIYTIGFLLYMIYQVNEDKKIHKIGFQTIIFGTLFQSILLVWTGVKAGHIPAFGMQNSFLLASWSISVFFIILYLKYKMDLLGGAVSCFLSIMAITSLFLPQSSFAGQNDLNIFMIALHVFFTFFANAAFFMAFVLGFFYLFQERNIKGKKHGIFFKKLPPLEILESAGNFCILTGFVFLTTGLASGVVWSKHIFGTFIVWDSKEIWSFVIWILYAAIIHGRITSEWRGRKAALMAIIGFFIVTFSFIGINVFMDASHGEYFMGTKNIQG